MNNVWFMIASGLCVLSIFCSAVAVFKVRDARRLYSDSLENLRAAHQVREEVHRMANKYVDVSDLSSGPKYREYGDLS